MWIVKVALERPYTFIVLALLIVIIGPLTLLRTPTDILPNIGIPVVSVVWAYTGLPPNEMADRIVGNFERAITTTVNDVEHLESQSVTGVGVIKVFFQPNVKIDMAVAQVTAIAQTLLRNYPQGTTPPLILSYNASSVPVIQLTLSSSSIPEQELFDLGNSFIRTQISTVAGASIPYPYGGKQRQVQVDLDQKALQSYGLSPADVNAAIGSQNLILPAGTEKIGSYEYNIKLNGSPLKVEDMNDLPIKAVNGTTIYVHDVAHVRDGYPPQQNIVRINGERAVLMTIQKTGTASTLDIINQIKAKMPEINAAAPPGVKVGTTGDQSVFVTAAVQGVLREGAIAAALTGLMILLFLGSWRSTIIIAISIPLSILVSLIALSALGETVNIMTLGGLALAVGILVDDATVTIENINYHLEHGKEVEEAILDGAQQIAIPALVSTLCICIVFVPMFLLGGVAKYLFVPLAEAVVFAMLASYALSRTLVPTLANYWLQKHDVERDPSFEAPAGGPPPTTEAAPHPAASSSAPPLGEQHALLEYQAPALLTYEGQPHSGGGSPERRTKKVGLFTRFQKKFESGFEKFRGSYHDLLALALEHRLLFAGGFMMFVVLSFGLAPFLGSDFFPSVDGGQIKLHVRAHAGTRVEETARLCDQVEMLLREIIPPAELDTVVDNIGLPVSGINLSYSNSRPSGPADADILISLKNDHHSIFDYQDAMRKALRANFPGVDFAFLPADITTQVLNFGQPAAIDVQVTGRNVAANAKYANDLLARMAHIPGIADLRIQQQFDDPEFRINVDRSRAEELGIQQRDVANSLLISLSGSFQTAPTFYLNPQNGVSYNVVTQTPQYQLTSLDALKNVPITGTANRQPQILGALSHIQRGIGPAVISHYNVAPIIDIFASVSHRDLGGVGADIRQLIKETKGEIPKTTTVLARGQMETMDSAFTGLYEGLAFAILLVYLLIVVNFQSWLDPFIIITALPGALAGIVWMLFVTHTTLSVPALTGAIMCMGVATANSVLVVSFARERMDAGLSPHDAALESGFTRFRPVLMTALAMIIGMLPMSLGLGEGGEQNAPLGRAVIGGLSIATLATLFFVPTVFTLVHGWGDKAYQPGRPGRHNRNRNENGTSQEEYPA